MVPEAHFDVLFILEQLGAIQPRPTSAETHLVAYLACLVRLYTGRPVSEWGYVFALAEGRPFAAEIEQALNNLQSRGLVSVDSEQELTITTRGRAELGALTRLHLGKRATVLDAACTACSSLPLPSVRGALLQDAQVGPLARLQQSSILFEGPSLQLMHRQFEELRKGTGEVSTDPTLPAMLWVAYYDYLARTLSYATEATNDAS